MKAYYKCVAESLAYSRLRPDLESASLTEPEVMHFVDGSCFKDQEGNHAGYAVEQMLWSGLFSTTKAEQVPQPCSAQKAKLLALI